MPEERPHGSTCNYATKWMQLDKIKVSEAPVIVTRIEFPIVVGLIAAIAGFGSSGKNVGQLHAKDHD
ncbi:predicted protein [Pyrenophora tritici-repentis Pt-1C-BFP]|uniref:Uncharacterized protein n=1 Tax=Pyrenophora tritici-repentis (strain Pt-1C-BFP) TaxID=426418 RepID=B2WMG6_PYRTR|nr:uncharacterized protein PTRG_11176 [Pyrenophora tritici-repentis Pt-1C-BFP]EDU44226.1 predicted protein [Pyrenophora tritici-repentis Pt-1C-BFP]